MKRITLLFLILLLLIDSVLWLCTLIKATGYISPPVYRLIPQTRTKQKPQLLGFLPYWSAADQTKVYPQYFSQIIYFGLGVTRDGNLITRDESGQPTPDWIYFTSDYFKNLTAEAKSNQTKVLITLKCFNNSTIDNLISNQTAVNRLTQQVIDLISKYDLDGVNLDFEYITDSTFPTAQYLNQFLTTLTEKLKQVNPKLIVSFDVNTSAVINDQAYDMDKIGEIVDQVILMGYDFRRQEATRAGPTAPLVSQQDEHSISQSIQALTKKIPRQKIILAIPLYGYEWQTETDQYQSATVPGSGTLATYEQVKALLLQNNTIEKHWNDLAQSPWLSYTQSGVIKQIYYEDDQSLKAKIKFSRENNLAGVAVWALGYEGGDKNLWQIF